MKRIAFGSWEGVLLALEGIGTCYHRCHIHLDFTMDNHQDSPIVPFSYFRTLLSAILR